MVYLSTTKTISSYSNIPEEVTYYMARWDNYNFLFWATSAINFIFPFLMLMSRDGKRNFNFIMIVGSIVLIGHWFNVFLMIIPGTLFDHWHNGDAIQQHRHWISLQYAIFHFKASNSIFATKTP